MAAPTYTQTPFGFFWVNDAGDTIPTPNHQEIHSDTGGQLWQFDIFAAPQGVWKLYKGYGLPAPTPGTIVVSGSPSSSVSLVPDVDERYWSSLDARPPDPIRDMQRNVEAPACDCGGHKAKTPHSSWCSTRSK